MNGRSSINISLEEEATSLNDIVVIGYGTSKRKDLTGTVSSINAAQLEKFLYPMQLKLLPAGCPA